MCGRFVRKTEIDDLAAEFEVQKIDCDLGPSYNIAPTQQVAVIIEDGVRQLVAVRWGLVPYWATDLSIGNKMINARAESVADKAAFKESFALRRCLVVADGFYEWQKSGKEKTPIFIRLKSQEPFGFAGLYDNWTAEDGARIRTCTIITTDANELLKPIHNRMPVIIPKSRQAEWLTPVAPDPAALLGLLKPYPAEEMETYQVSSLVNAPANDLPECMNPVPNTGPAQAFLPFF